MHDKTTTLLFALTCSASIAAQHNVPRTWDEAAITSMHLPLAVTGKHAVPVSAAYYERMPQLRIFKSYPVYHPDHEPEGYMAHLASLEPEIVFDAQEVRTEEEWVRAGQHVFEVPVIYPPPLAVRRLVLGNPKWWKFVQAKLTKDGVLPIARWVVRKKGVVEYGFGSCATCHTPTRHPQSEDPLACVQCHVTTGHARERTARARSLGIGPAIPAPGPPTPPPPPPDPDAEDDEWDDTDDTQSPLRCSARGIARCSTCHNGRSHGNGAKPAALPNILAADDAFTCRRCHHTGRW